MKKKMKIYIKNKKRIVKILIKKININNLINKILIKKINNNNLINKPIFINLATNYKIKFIIFGKIDIYIKNNIL